MRHRRKRAFGLALTAIATGATVAVMTACASSGSRPATQAAPTHPAATQASTPQEFVSKRYWSEVDASLAWDGRGLQAPGSAFFANFADPMTSRTLLAAAATAPKGMKLAGRVAGGHGARPPFRLFRALVCGGDDSRRRPGPSLDGGVRRRDGQFEQGRRTA